MSAPSPEAVSCAEAISKALFYSESEPGKPGARVIVGMEIATVAALVQKALDQRDERSQRHALEAAVAAAEVAHGVCLLPSCMLCATIKTQREALR